MATLKPGMTYGFDAWYVDVSSNASFKLYWQPPGEANFAIIPTENLYRDLPQVVQPPLVTGPNGQ
jgi:hypothetical protein